MREGTKILKGGTKDKTENCCDSEFKKAIIERDSKNTSNESKYKWKQTPRCRREMKRRVVEKEKCTQKNKSKI